MRTLTVLLLLCGTCTAAPVSSDYTCVQGHEQDATNKLQDYIKHAATNFFRSRRIAIDPSTLQVNVSLTIQTGMATRPYVAFTGNAGSGLAANLGPGALGSPNGPAPSPSAGAAANPGGGAAGLPGTAANRGGGTAGIPGAAANSGASGAANPAGAGTGYAGGGGLGVSSVAAIVSAKDGTRFNLYFSSGSDTQDAGEYRIIATQRGFTREGNPIGRHCRLRLFEFWRLRCHQEAARRQCWLGARAGPDPIALRDMALLEERVRNVVARMSSPAGARLPMARSRNRRTVLEGNPFERIDIGVVICRQNATNNRTRRRVAVQVRRLHRARSSRHGQAGRLVPARG